MQQGVAQALVSAGSDSCATPDPISGLGSFPVSNVGATTGAEGQVEGICLNAGSTNLYQDVWLVWTAPSTDVFVLDMCAGVSGVDSKVAVYGGSTCPLDGTSIACNDDSCGLISKLTFSAVSGQQYMFQFGTYSPAGATYSGSFDLSVAPPPPANDGCATPTNIGGAFGTFPVDNTNATTGPDGQTEAACTFFGFSNMYQDVWYEWTSPVTGAVDVTACNGLGGVDTRLGVYPGGACPTAGSAIACNDDFCGFTSKVTFNAVSGQSYLFQFAAFSATTPSYSGTFDVLLAPPPPANDSCATPTFVGNTLGTFPVDNTNATTGTEGQTEALCFQNGFSDMYQDVWVTWTAPTTDAFDVTLCNGIGPGEDPRLAVYAGTGCPTPGSALACNDDSCNFVSKVTFNGVAGQTYLFQFAAFSATTPTYSGTFDVALAPPPTPDDCAMPLAISGPGPHPVNTTTATTGTEGQTESLCNFFGSTVIDNDGWFEYTAGINGIATLSLCGGTAGDTKVAIYPGGACPTAGSALACNDDFCGLTSQVGWSITGGSTYLIQIGSFPGTVGGHSGTFTITESIPAPNDDCSAPIVLVGAGPYSFDNTVASTSTQGQTEQKCLFFGSTTVDNDVWYEWTAPSTGIFELSTIAQTVVDTKIAVYDGPGCPAAPALSCDDDNCFTLQTGLTFGAVGGNTYTIQIGTFPGATGGTGQFSIQPATLVVGCQADDGTSENSVGLGLGGSIVVLNRFGAIGQSTTITDVSAAYGTPLFPGNAPPNGSPVDILVYDDPNDDGQPGDCVLVAQVASTIQNVDTDIMNVVALTSPVTVMGIFFVGVGEPHPQGTFPAAFDQSGACQIGESWYFGDPSGVVNYGSPSSNTFPPTEIGADGLPGVWMLRASCTNGPGTEYCAGDGLDPVVTTPCPCGNFGAAGNGCRSSFNPAGAHLTAIGATNPDSVVLQGSGMNATGNCIFLKGSIEDPFAYVFGDGITCVGGSLIRMRTKTLTAGAASFPEPGDPSVSVRGATPPGSGLLGVYGAYYRNAAAAFCPPATFNITNSYKIIW